MYTICLVVSKNSCYIKQKSSENKTPSLPRNGAQQMAKQISMLSQNADFLKTPEAGIAG